MLVGRLPHMFTIFCLTLHLVHCATIQDILKTKTSSTDLLAIIRVPRDTAQLTEEASISRKARDNRYSDKYAPSYKEDDRSDRSLKPEDNSEDAKTNTNLGKRCITCDSGYLSSGYGGYDRGRDRYDRYDRDPYYSSNTRGRYDPYDRYDDYDYRGRGRYSSTSSYHDRYDPRDRYDRGYGYDTSRSSYGDRDYGRDRYDPYDDYSYRGSGYDNYSSRGSYSRPSDYGGSYGGYGGGSYARGYGYADRDRYGGYGSSLGGYGGYGSGYGGYGSSGSGSGGYRSYGTGSSRYPSSDYDSGYRYTSYLYGRPSSSTTPDTPIKSADEGQAGSTSSSISQGSSSARSK